MCEPSEYGQINLFNKMKAVDKKGGGSTDVNLLPDSFEYEMLPYSVTVKAMTNDEQFFKTDHNYNVKLEKVAEN